MNFILQLLLFKQRSAFLRYEQRNVNIFQAEEATYGFFAFIRYSKSLPFLTRKKVSKKFGMLFKISCKVFSNLLEKCSFCSCSFTYFFNFFLIIYRTYHSSYFFLLTHMLFFLWVEIRCFLFKYKGKIFTLLWYIIM